MAKTIDGITFSNLSRIGIGSPFNNVAFDASTDAALKTSNPSTQYYWYIGQTDPSTMDSITPIVENNSLLPGWRYIGSSLPTYSTSNKLWSYTTGDINMSTLNNIYIAVPNTTLVPRDGVGGDEVLNGAYEKLSNTKPINGVTYTIYKSTSKYLMAFTEDIY